ncbi:MAG: hypothetical protein JW862_12230 [Anaerolineales bacterium]|nr:hypothetical protein [Anaerolineales bacterium]
MNNQYGTPAMQISKIAHFHQDGLLDLFAGLLIGLSGAAMLSEMIWMGGVFVAIFLPLWISARQKITYPRVAHLPTTSKQQARTQKLLFTGMLMLGILALAGAAMFFGFDFLESPAGSWLQGNVLFILGATFGTFWGTIGLVLHQVRMYLYGLLTLLAFSAAQLAWLDFPWALALLGALISLGGLLTLIRFLQRYRLEDRR